MAQFVIVCDYGTKPVTVQNITCTVESCSVTVTTATPSLIRQALDDHQAKKVDLWILMREFVEPPISLWERTEEIACLACDVPPCDETIVTSAQQQVEMVCDFIQVARDMCTALNNCFARVDAQLFGLLLPSEFQKKLDPITLDQQWLTNMYSTVYIYLVWKRDSVLLSHGANILQLQALCAAERSNMPQMFFEEVVPRNGVQNSLVMEALTCRARELVQTLRNVIDEHYLPEGAPDYDWSTDAAVDDSKNELDDNISDADRCLLDELADLQNFLCGRGVQEANHYFRPQ